MRLSLRVRVALAGTALVLAAGVSALPWLSSHMLSTGLQALAIEHAKGDLRIRHLAHQAGWLSSSGTLDLEWHAQCAEDAEGPAMVHVQYHARHVPDWNGWMRLDWSAAPAGEASGGVKQLLRGGRLTGTGVAGLDGSFRTDMQLPALGMVVHGETLQATPSAGRMELGKTALRLDWMLERVAWQGPGKSLEAQRVALSLDLKNRAAGTGRATLDMDSLRTADITLHGLRLSSETTERADRLDAKVTQSVRSAQFLGQNLQDLVLEAEVKGLHTASVQTLSQVYSERCALQSATADDKQQMRAAVKKLLLAGFSVGIPKLQGGNREGSLDGKLLLSLAPAQGDEVLLASQLSSSGQMNIKGTLMPPEQKAFALSTGYVNEVADGVQARFEYGGGILKVSGKTLDAAMVQLGLQKLDAWLRAFLAGESLALPAEEVPAVPPSEAPAAASAVPAS
nr:DUF945 family protein [uncultured Rhodoferax sp.]